MNEIFRPKTEFNNPDVAVKQRQFIETTLIAISMCVFTLLITNVSFGQKTLTAAQVNGTWSKGEDKIRVFALGRQKLKVEYSGLYEYKYKGDPIGNLGEAKGTAVIDGNIAIFQDEKDANCKMTMKFTGSRLKIESEGCTFGQHVNAGGVYRKINSRKPRFDW